jgi:hypothetical protein
MTLLLLAMQALNLWVLRWVGTHMVFARPHDRIGFNWHPALRAAAINLPVVVFLGLIVMAFFIATSPWWLLVASVVGLFYFTPRPPSLRVPRKKA